MRILYICLLLLLTQTPTYAGRLSSWFDPVGNRVTDPVAALDDLRGHIITFPGTTTEPGGIYRLVGPVDLGDASRGSDNLIFLVEALATIDQVIVQYMMKLDDGSTDYRTITANSSGVYQDCLRVYKTGEANRWPSDEQQVASSLLVITSWMQGNTPGK